MRYENKLPQEALRERQLSKRKRSLLSAILGQQCELKLTLKAQGSMNIELTLLTLM